MKNVMMIDNISYALTEITGRTFILKDDVEEAMKGEHPIFLMPLAKKSMIFDGKFYAYSRLKPKKR